VGVRNRVIGEYGALTNSISRLNSYLLHTRTLSGFPEELATVVVTDATIWYVTCAELPCVTFIGFIPLPFTALVVNGEMNSGSLTNRRLCVLFFFYGHVTVHR